MTRLKLFLHFLFYGNCLQCGGTERPGHVGVLFVIKIDASLRVVPYAEVHEHSVFTDEAEVLFAMHSIFKIGEIGKCPHGSNIYQVQLHLTDEDDPKLTELKTYIAGQYGGCAGHHLGRTLMDMQANAKAEEIYLDLLTTTTNERDKGAYNHCLGLIKQNEGEYERALQYYHMAVGMYTRVFPENDPEFAKTYNQIGLVYFYTGEYPKALDYYQKDIAIKKKTFPENHPDLASSYNNIGLVYFYTGEYSKALEHYEKSLEIKKKTLPKNHHEIATSYLNLGVLFYRMKKYEQALEYFEEAKRINTISLPPKHPEMKKTLDWIEHVKKNMK